MSRPLRLSGGRSDEPRCRAFSGDQDRWRRIPERPRGVMFRPEQQDGQTRLDLLQVSTDGQLLVAAECGTDDGEVIAADGSAPNGAIDGDEEVSVVTGLGEEIRSRTQLGHVSANRKYSADSRIGEERAIYSSNRRYGYRETSHWCRLKTFGPIQIEATRCPLVYISQGKRASEKSGSRVQ